MEQTLLTPDQRAVATLVAAEPRLAGYYLAGGTALSAYYLRHRVSDDLDFFTSDPVDGTFLQSFSDRIRQHLRTDPPQFEKLYDRRLFLFPTARGPLKVEFTRYPFPQFEPPREMDGLRVDGLRDIAANKFFTMLDRFDPKDFVDLYFLLQTRRLEDVKADAETKFKTKVDPVFLGGELAKVRRIAALPKMIRSLDLAELRSFFFGLAKTLSPSIFI
jgi:predicted nucleotidyltransferase component of viral defense system